MEVVQADMSEALRDLQGLVAAVTKKWIVYLPSVKVESAIGKVEVLLGGWDGSNWVTKPIATLNSNQSCTAKLNSVVEGKPKSGEYLLVRAKDGAVAVKIENYEKFGALLKKVTPQVFPWWNGTLLDYTWLSGNSQLPLIFNSNEQFVLYYFRVA
jgi:hypothetical protein